MPRHIYPTPFIIRPPDDLCQKKPELRRLSQGLALKYASKQFVTDEDLQFMGSALWQVLDMDGAFDQEHKAAGAAILPIIIESEAADVQSLPWETLFHTSYGFLGKHPGFTLSRRIRVDRERSSPIEKGPLRVLLFTSLPEDLHPETSRLNVEEEQIQVQEALMPWISKGFVKLEMPDDGRFSTLKELLKTFQPHLLFLSGHGTFHHEPHSGESPYGEFSFESESGKSSKVRDDQIARALIGMGVQVVVLSACESGKAASDALNIGLTQKLGVQGIPHVIGMRESILDQAGIQFARVLCDELAQQERIDIALQTAREAVQTPLKEAGRREATFTSIAELSMGQWCLPMLLSTNPEQALIDWDFQPLKVETRLVGESIKTVSLPARFVGRRAEMRQYENRILKGDVQKLLITGPGGQGKTALAGKLAMNLGYHGYRLFAWSSRSENPWRTFQFEMEVALTGEFAKQYDRMRPQVKNEAEHSQLLLRLLMQQFDGHLVIFLDNLESLQNPDTLVLNDTSVTTWIQTAQSLQGLILLVTSRWLLPFWPGEHLPLTHSNYGDFLQMAQQMGTRGQLPMTLLGQREQLRHIYDVLGGNGRALEFYGAAIHSMEKPAEESEFLERLIQTKAEIQADMALNEIYKRLQANARTLLSRLPVYDQPVPMEGVIKLGLDLNEDPDSLLASLLAVSLVETQLEPSWDVVQYQCSPLVANWLRENNHVDSDPHWLNAAADYQVYLYLNERSTLTQAIIAHEALRRAGRKSQADRLALDHIVGRLSLEGFYHTLLSDWLPDICQSEDPAIRAQALRQTGKQNLNIGEYETALFYLEQSQVIFKQIDDRENEARTLNNISQIYDSQGDKKAALSYLQKSLDIQQHIEDKSGEGDTLNNIANIYLSQGKYETALSYLQQSLAIHQQIGNKKGEGITLNNISQIYNARGDYKTALTYLQKSLALQVQIGDKAGEGVTLNNIANIFLAQADYDNALFYLQKSLVIREQIGDIAGEGSTLNNISQAYHAKGDYQTALSYLQKSQTLHKQVGDKAGEGTTLSNIANIYLIQGDSETALSYMQQSLAINQQIGNKKGEGITLNNIANIYLSRREINTAFSYLQQSLAIQQQIGDKASEGVTLGNIASIYHAQGNYEEALSCLHQSLAIQQKIGDKKGEGTTLNNISQIYSTRGDDETARSFLQKSLAIQQEIGDRVGLCATLFNLGLNHYKNNQKEEAFTNWVTVYNVAKQIRLAQALQALAELAPQLGMQAGLEGWEKLAQQIKDQS